MIRSFKLQIYLTSRQEKYLKRCCIVTRILYNETLNLRYGKYFRARSFQGLMGKSPYQYHKALAKAGNTDDWKSPSDPSYTDFDEKFPWMRELSSYIRREAVKDANEAYKKFFQGLSKFPRYKNKKSPLQCRNAQGSSIKLIANEKLSDYAAQIIIPGVGIIKLSRDNYVPLNNKIIQCAFKYKNGKWIVAIAMHLKDQEQPSLNGRLGIDLGCRSIAATSHKQNFKQSDSQKIQLTKLERRRIKWERIRSRRFIKGAKQQSKNYYEAKNKVEKIYGKILFLQEDIVHKITARIANSNVESIILEDLNIKNMMQNGRIAPSLQKGALFKTKQQIIYKAKEKGTKIFQVPTTFPSTQTCPNCGNIKGRNGTKKQNSSKIYTCSICEFSGDRDVDVAAVNLAKADQKILKEI